MISKRGWVNLKGTTHTRSNETVSPGSRPSRRGCIPQRHKFADNSAGLHNYCAKEAVLQSRRSSKAATGFFVFFVFTYPVEAGSSLETKTHCYHQGALQLPTKKHGRESLGGVRRAGDGGTLSAVMLLPPSVLAGVLPSQNVTNNVDVHHSSPPRTLTWS